MHSYHLLQLINKTKAQTVYKKPNKGREAKMKTLGSMPRTWQVRLYKGVQPVSYLPTYYLPVCLVQDYRRDTFLALKVPLGNKC